MTTNNSQHEEHNPQRRGASGHNQLRKPLIGIVGPCGSGKSTLVAGLNGRGYAARHIAQEHSYVRDMWQRLTQPDVLVFLDASYPVTCARRRLNWTEADWQEQQRRLEHARRHADLYLHTDNLGIAEVLEQVITFINNKISSQQQRG